jgi:anti-anti-sigma factor
MSAFNIHVVEGSPHRVFLAGEIDIVTASRVTEVLCELSGDIKVDCAKVTFIDTAGFNALDWAYVVATARGHTFAVVALRDFQARVADLLRVPYGRTG